MTTTPATLTPVETLRGAARVLRALADDATQGPWARRAFEPHGPRIGVWRPGEEYGPAPALVVSGGAINQRDADYICAIHPGVGALVADILTAVADDVEQLDEHDGYDPTVTVPGCSQAMAAATAVLRQDTPA